MLEVGHALLLVAFLADVGDVRDGVAAVAAECLVALRAPRARFLTAPGAGGEAVQEIADVDGVVLAKGVGRIGLAQRCRVGRDTEAVVTGTEIVVAAWVFQVQRAESASVVSVVPRVLRICPTRRQRLAVRNEFAALVETARPILFVEQVDVVVDLVDVRAQGRRVLGVGVVPEGVGLGRQVQFAVLVAQGNAPIAGQAVAALAVGGQQLAGPAGGVDDVVWPRRERHAVRIADLQGEDGAGAVALGAGQKAEGAIGCAVLQRLLELVVDHQAVEVLARDDVDDAGDGLGAVKGGCAVEDVVDALHGDVRIEVRQVGTGAAGVRPVAVDVGGHAVAVHERHRGAGADAAQVGVGLAALGPVRPIHALVPAFAGALAVRAADLRGVGVGVDADLVGLVEDHVAQVGRAGQFHVDLADHVHRRGQVEVGAPDVRPGDDHLLDGAVLAFFVLVVFVIRLRRQHSDRKQDRHSGKRSPQAVSKPHGIPSCCRRKASSRRRTFH